MFNKVLKHYFGAYVYVQDVSHKSKKKNQPKIKAGTNELAIGKYAFYI